MDTGAISTMSLPEHIGLNPDEEHFATYYPRIVFYVVVALITGSSGLFLAIFIYQLAMAWQREGLKITLDEVLGAMYLSIAWLLGRRAIYLTTQRLILETPGRPAMGVGLGDIQAIEVSRKVLGGNLRLQIAGEQRPVVLKVMRPEQLATEIQQACLACGEACPAQ